VIEPKDKDNVISPDEYAEDIDLQAFAQGRKSSNDVPKKRSMISSIGYRGEE